MDAAAFERADSSNLPKIDAYMLMEYMRNSTKHNVAEIRNAKALSTSRESYVEKAIGYVEIRRDGSLCDVQAKVVPEHKISNKYYVVIINIDESNESITDSSCDGCAAAAGGCKHTLVVLNWLLKRSTEPSPTSVQCYWTKPSLKGARENPLTCQDMAKGQVVKRGPKDPTVLIRLRNEARKHACGNSLLMAYDPDTQTEKITKYCVYDMMVNFLNNQNRPNFEEFKKFSNDLVERNKEKINEETKGQVNSKQWHCIRQARITGSKIYEVAHCKTPDGSLVEELLGGYKAPETKAMKRGKTLEKAVLKKLQSEMNQEITECGFMIINGIFGASPDGIGDEYVVEIKCPISEKTEKNYIKNGKICNKFMGQVQLEMLAVGKKKCLFCVADPKFESNGKIKKLFVNYDEKYTQNLMQAAENFWKLNIFPKILKSAATSNT